MTSWLTAFFGGLEEFQGKPLQKTGDLSREQLLQFFAHGTELFSNLDFKRAMNEGFMQGRSPQEMVNQAQAKLFEEKVQPAVQGDYGIHYLQYVLSKFADDPEFTAKFYQFVHLEERTLDEAEMAPEDYHTKYSRIDAVKVAMEEQLKQNEERMQGMSEQQKQQFISQLYQRLVTEGLYMDPSSVGAMMPGMAPSAAPTQAPGMQDEPPSRTQPGPSIGFQPPGAKAMSENEQLAFFKSMATAPQ